jgi:predicted NAD/FAD-binding protein
MLSDIIKFNKHAPHYLDKPTDITIRQCLDELGLGQWFRDYYLQAMGAAIWSCPLSKIEDFPAKTFVRFFQNHGLLTVNDQPQWYSVTGGSREYIKILTKDYKDKIRLSSGVRKIIRDSKSVTLTLEDGSEEFFDQVVFACHADQVLQMIDTPTDEEKDVIGAFQYQNNKIVVHSDLSFMPSDKSCWASWVYLSQNRQDEGDAVALSYWMNNLQNIKTTKPVIVTLNPAKLPAAELIYDTHHFDHPVFHREAIEAQDKIADIQGHNNCWYVGAYQRYGFHEDGLLSAVNVMEKMGVDIPWR